MELATRLILDGCGGEPSEVIVAGADPAARTPVEFKLRDMTRLTGVEMKPARMASILRDLGFDPGKTGSKDESWTVAVPTFRPDVEGSADLVEELIRIEGFDALPDAPLPPLESERASRVVVTPLQNRIRTTRRVLAARGFLETVTWSFMARDKATLVLGGNGLSDALTIDNPIASDLDYMRPTMLANLAEAAQRNADHGAEDVRLFEAGPVYVSDQPDGQHARIAAVVRAAKARNWSGPVPAYDAYAAKADLFAMLAALDQPGERFQIGAADGPHWHPGRAGTLKLGPKLTVAAFGELHPGFLKALRVDGPVIAFELYLDALPAAKGKSGKTKPLLNKADLTPIRRDFAFVVDEKVNAADILRAAAKADPKLITAVNVFDVYRGAGVGDGKKSVAIEITIQPRGEALKDAEIEKIAASVVAAITKATGGALRG